MKDRKEELELAVCIAIQKVGLATVDDIVEKLKEWEIKATKSNVRRFCMNLQKKSLVSLNYVQKDGLSKSAYSLSKGIFQRDIPIANYKDIVDLKNTKEAKEFIEKMEKKKEICKGRLPDHRNYYMVEVKFEVLDKVLGFMPFHEQGFNEHYRDGKNIILLPCHFRAWVGTNLRLVNKPESMKNYIGFNYGKIELNGNKIERMEFTVLDRKQGRGFVKYEALPKGTTITTAFRVPETDFIRTEFKKFLETICSNPIRGLSGRAITGFGHLKLLEYKVER